MFQKITGEVSHDQRGPVSFADVGESALYDMTVRGASTVHVRMRFLDPRKKILVHSII